MAAPAPYSSSLCCPASRTGTAGYSGDGGPASAAQFAAGNITLDAAGNLYISDDHAHVIRKVAPGSHTAYLNGYEDGTFHPDAEITRAELSKVLAVAFGLDTAAAPPAGFSDVAADFWAAPYINAVKAKGLVKGYPDGTFAPGNPVTHGELGAIIARQVGLQPVVGVTGHWAAGYVAAIRHAGYLQDFPKGPFDPDAHATRAEVVVLADLALGRGKLQGSFTPKFSDVPASHWAASYIQDTSTSGGAP